MHAGGSWTLDELSPLCASVLTLQRRRVVKFVQSITFAVCHMLVMWLRWVDAVRLYLDMPQRQANLLAQLLEGRAGKLRFIA